MQGTGLQNEMELVGARRQIAHQPRRACNAGGLQQTVVTAWAVAEVRLALQLLVLLFI